MTGTVFNDKNDNDTSGNYNNNDVYVAYVELSSIVGAKTKVGQRPKMNLRRGRVFRYFI